MSCKIGLDHDPVIICPYDRNHKIARSRIQRHLVKCEKNFPPNYKKQCPYDATHRIFEHELIEHVKNCPMKYTCPIDSGQNGQGLSNITIQKDNESNIDEEIWDEDLPDTSIASNLENELSFEHVLKSKSNIIVAKRYSNKLRRPFGYSESLMLETSSLSTDEDENSVTSDMHIGRGRSIPGVYCEQYKRETNHFYRRGNTGRVLH